MNITTITIEFDGAEGALRRLLGLIEARGFDVRAMSMEKNLDRSDMTVGVAPRDDGRCIDVLSRQLARLHGVHRVARASAGGTHDV